MGQPAEPLQRAAEFWNTRPPAPTKSRWWNWPRILAFQNERVCGRRLTGWNAGLLQELERRCGGRQLSRAISIGCGAGAKEMALLEKGIVQEFDLFEVSTVRTEQGQRSFQKEGLGDRARWHNSDGLQVLERGPAYDLVFWDNALHHMPDTPRAVQASLTGLKPGGAFVMNDFVGASRFQWSDRQLQYASRIRQSLSDRLLRNPWKPGEQLERSVIRPTVESMIAADPSEAADSDRIIASIKEVLPNPELWLLGGAVYHLALNDVLANFDEQLDADLLESLLVLESALIELGENQYAACLSIVG